MTWLIAFVHSQLFVVIWVAFSGAAGADLQVLVSTGEVRGWAALKDFQWNIASFRWFAGVATAVVGYIAIHLIKQGAAQ